MLVFITNDTRHRIWESMGLSHDPEGDPPEIVIRTSGALALKCEGRNIPLAEMPPPWKHEAMAAIAETMARRARRLVDEGYGTPLPEIYPWAKALAQLAEGAS